jgi:two-component system chemotaxis response regulator CheY
MTILVVDDAGFARNVLVSMIVEMGYQVIGEALNGEDAVKKAKELKPDVIAMDIIMPKMNGIEAVKEIVKDNPEAYIIMCSAMGQRNMVIQSIVAGAKDFIVKPINKERLADSLDKCKKQLNC